MSENMMSEIKCCSCGANINIDFENLISFCPYCGAKLIVDLKLVQDVLKEREKTKQIQIQAEQMTAQKKMEYDVELRKLEIEREESKQSDNVRIKILIGSSIFMILMYLLLYFLY